MMLLNCAYILVRVLEKTGFHYFIFHRKPLHWDGHGLGLGTVALAWSVLALLTSLDLSIGADSTGAAVKMSQYPQHNRTGAKVSFSQIGYYFHFAPDTISTLLSYTKMVRIAAIRTVCATNKKAGLSQRFGCPENFRESLTTPTATFPEIFNGLLLGWTL